MTLKHRYANSPSGGGHLGDVEVSKGVFGRNIRGILTKFIGVQLKAGYKHNSI